MPPVVTKTGRIGRKKRRDNTSRIEKRNRPKLLNRESSPANDLDPDPSENERNEISLSPANRISLSPANRRKLLNRESSPANDPDPDPSKNERDEIYLSPSLQTNRRLGLSSTDHHTRSCRVLPERRHFGDLGTEAKYRRLNWARKHANEDFWDDGFMLATTLYIDMTSPGGRRLYDYCFKLDIYITAYMEEPGMVLIRRHLDVDTDYYNYFDPARQREILAPQFDLASIAGGLFTDDLNPINDLLPALLDQFRHYLCGESDDDDGMYHSDEEPPDPQRRVEYKLPSGLDEEIAEYNRFFKQAWGNLWLKHFRSVVTHELPVRVRRVMEADGDYLSDRLVWDGRISTVEWPV